MTSPWDDGQIAMLKRLWADGLSASQIAARLAQGVTRNAVIGKVHRLHIAHPVKPSPPPKDPNHPFKRTAEENRLRREQRAARRVGPSLAAVSPTKANPPALAVARPAPPVPRLALVPKPRSKPVAAPPIAREPALMPEGGRLTVLHLSDKTCRWPIGDVGTKDFCFCGNRPETVPPYCDFHTRVASNGFPTRSRRSATVDRRWGA